MVDIDFEKYWQELRDEVSEVDTDSERTHRTELVTSRGKRWRIDWVRFSSICDQVISGWIAVPEDHPANGSGFVWLPGYSYGTPPPDDSNLTAGGVTLAINVHGKPPDEPYINPAGKNDYILNGIASPQTFIYRRIVGHSLRALDVLLDQPEITSGIGVCGMSQGGGLALIVAAQSAVPKFCCADMPFLTDIPRSLEISHSGAYRSVKKYVEDHPDVMRTLLLFDTLNHAPLVHVPVWLSAGGKDPACKAETVETLYELLHGVERQYMFFPKAGHVFLPEMNEAYARMIERHTSRSCELNEKDIHAAAVKYN